MPSSFLKTYVSGLSSILSSIDGSEFERLIECLREAHERGAQIFVFGNGGSGATASHFACDFNKGVSYGKTKRFRIICLNDNVPTMLAYANDVSYDEVFVEQLKNLMQKGDLVIGISGSGNSKNVLRAIEHANHHGAETFGLCGYGGGKLKQAARNALTVQSNDMQKVEDAHSIVLHCAMQYFSRDARE